MRESVLGYSGWVIQGVGESQGDLSRRIVDSGREEHIYENISERMGSSEAPDGARRDADPALGFGFSLATPVLQPEGGCGFRRFGRPNSG